MAIVSLLVMPYEERYGAESRTAMPEAKRQVFAFEHMMAHRQLMGGIASSTTGLSGFSVLPYMLDPEQQTAQQASLWHLNHGQAHQDATQNLPGWFGWWALATPRPATQVGSFKDFADKNLASKASTGWWTFINHQEHYIKNQVLPATFPAYPFW
ncbi:MAG TPA: hypothetical protein VHT52_17880 [Stellaceae bacterium]|jgi:hypothetical protein|nr:hypothetical protein [Stellaceae bacterium]